MKTKVLVFFSASLILFSCSKTKNISAKKIESQIETAQISKQGLEHESKHAEVDQWVEVLSSASSSSTASPNFASKDISQMSEKKSLTEKEQKMVDKIERRIEKIEKKQDSKKGGLTDRMKLGIVLAAVGIILIVLGGFWGIFYLLGVIAFLIGAVLILLELLDM